MPTSGIGKLIGLFQLKLSSHIGELTMSTACHISVINLVSMKAFVIGYLFLSLGLHHGQKVPVP